MIDADTELARFYCDIMRIQLKLVFLEKAASLSCIFSIAYKKYKSKASGKEAIYNFRYCHNPLTELQLLHFQHYRIDVVRPCLP